MPSTIERVSNGRSSAAPSNDFQSSGSTADLGYSPQVPETSAGERVSDRDVLLEAILDVRRSISRLEDSLTDRIRCVVVEEMCNMRESVQEELQVLKERICAIEDTTATPCTHAWEPDLSCNIVIRNLPEGKNENIVPKVNGLLKDGLKLSGVTVDSAERKKSFRRDIPGIVVATCRNRDDLSTVMKAKAKLADSRNFREVGIGRDKSKTERLYEANLRTLAKTIGQGRLQVRGDRLVPTGSHSNHESGQRRSWGFGRERRDRSSSPADPQRNQDNARRPTRRHDNGKRNSDRKDRRSGSQHGRGGNGDRR